MEIKGNELTKAQEKLVIDNMDYAKGISTQLAWKLPLQHKPNHKYGIPLEVEDIIAIGYVGLVQAAKRFDITSHDPSRATLNTNFKSYAYTRIRGAIIDECRKATFVRRRGLEKGIQFQMISLDLPMQSDDGDFTTWQLLSPDDNPDAWLDFQRIFETLTEREQRIIGGLMEGQTGRQLATEFNVTESRISQIAGEARTKLKEGMNDGQ